MILTLDRGLVAYDRALRAGTWAPTAQHAARLSSTVVAVIGYGRIGSEVARSARALGYRVLVHDPFVDPQAVASDGHEAVGIDEAVARADVITLHAPLTESTRHLLDARTLAAAKPGVRVVNTCRGPLVDEGALADALASGHVGSAALDVYATEPLPADSRLRTLDNVLLTPHAAWFSPEAMQDLPVHTARNAVDFLAGRPVPSIVNPDHARPRLRNRATRPDLGDPPVQLVRLGPLGQERPAVREDGVVYSLDPLTRDIDGAFLAADGVGRVRAALAAGALPVLDGADERRVGAPVARPTAVVCIGMNYAEHAAESGSAPPDVPIVFWKHSNTVVGPHDDVLVPPGATTVDWEVELGVVIGRRARYLSSPEEALDHVAGYVLSTTSPSATTR